MSVTGLEAQDLQWRKARRSAGNGACVEVAPVNGQIAVRDSMNPDGGRLRYPPQPWQAFVAAIKNGLIFEK
jgi:Domain of unknown function (DUF397)